MLKRISSKLSGATAPVLIISGVFLVWIMYGLGPVEFSSKEKVNFVVAKGEGFFQIAENLKKQNLVRSPLHFEMVVFFSGRVKKIQAGSFSLSPSMNPLSISKVLTKGTNDRRITLVEGLRQEQVGELLEKQGFKVQKGGWENEITSQGLEGRLFPDTYFFSPEASMGAILKIIDKNFQKKVVEGLKQEIKQSGLTIREVLIFASIVERESTKDDQKLVAGILLKRWRSGWPLQADATVQYAVATQYSKRDAQVDWWPKRLSKNDLAIKSPYNTYVSRGLPPTPICNPGLSAIRAVLGPKDSPYWFYLSDNNGKTYYAKTLEEHEKNIGNYLLK